MLGVSLPCVTPFPPTNQSHGGYSAGLSLGDLKIAWSLGGPLLVTMSAVGYHDTPANNWAVGL